MKTDRLKQSIRTAKAWAKVHLKEPIINKETGWPIEVGMNGIEHSLSFDLWNNKSGRYTELLSMVRKLKTMIRDATLFEKHSDKYKENEALTVYRFRCSVTIKGEENEVEIIVKEFIENKKLLVKKRLYYNHKFVIDQIKKP